MRAARVGRPLRRDIVVVEAIVALALARSALRLLPFRWLARGAGRLPTAPFASDPPDPYAAGVGRAVERAARRLPWRSTCLVRALAARMMLRRRGVPSVLCLGVAKDTDALRAHAWLLAGGGVVCGGPETPGYTPIAAFPAGRTP